MVKFVAKQAVDSSQLLGVSLLFRPETSYFYDRGGSSFRVAQDANKEGTLLKVDGHGFRSVFSDVTEAGTVKQLTVKLDGDALYKIKKVDVKLKKLMDTDLEGASHALFKGKDTFKGSEGNDVFHGGRGKDTLKGKGGNDALYGDAGRDRLEGGAGGDRLDGGKGKDTYVFKTALDLDQGDTIAKFQKGETIELSHKVFDVVAKGPLSADHFALGTGPTDEDDYIIYNRDTGGLFYDPDGTGSAPIVAIAYTQAGAKLDADSILVT